MFCYGCIFNIFFDVENFISIEKKEEITLEVCKPCPPSPPHSYSKEPVIHLSSSGFTFNLHPSLESHRSSEMFCVCMCSIFKNIVKRIQGSNIFWHQTYQMRKMSRKGQGLGLFESPLSLLPVTCPSKNCRGIPQWKPHLRRWEEINPDTLEKSEKRLFKYNRIISRYFSLVHF